jgi:hypothetical protein
MGAVQVTTDQTPYATNQGRGTFDEGVPFWVPYGLPEGPNATSVCVSLRLGVHAGVRRLLTIRDRHDFFRLYFRLNRPQPGASCLSPESAAETGVPDHDDHRKRARFVRAHAWPGAVRRDQPSVCCPQRTTLAAIPRRFQPKASKFRSSAFQATPGAGWSMPTRCWTRITTVAVFVAGN